jgi:hypothetical protein
LAPTDSSSEWSKGWIADEKAYLLDAIKVIPQHTAGLCSATEQGMELAAYNWSMAVNIRMAVITDTH